jgi:hypothetical protein
MSSIQKPELLKEALQTGDYSDLTISCGDDAHRVHRLIVCSQSKVLDAMCRSAFKVSTLRFLAMAAADRA